MGEPKGRSGARTHADRPPPKACLGVGVALVALNHLSVAAGMNLQPEALFLGSWAALLGGWGLFAPRSFGAAWSWADPSGWRIFGLVLLTLGVAFGPAEAVAWFAYGQHLRG